MSRNLKGSKGSSRKKKYRTSTSSSDVDSEETNSQQIIPSYALRRTSGYIRVLRVLKKDIRRKYQDMYYNVINSHDTWLFTNFLKEFANPNNCQFTITLPSQPDRPSILCNGIADVIYGMTQIHLKLPDAVHRFEDTAIHVPHHGSGSRIISKASFQGTRLFEIDNDHIAEEVHRMTVPSSSSLSPSSTSGDCDDTSLTSVEYMKQSSSLPNKESLPSYHRINHAINAADEILLPAMSFNTLNSKVRDNVILSSSSNEIENDLITRFQNLNLYRLYQPKILREEGYFIIHINELNQIETMHFQVQYVSQTIENKD